MPRSGSAVAPSLRGNPWVTALWVISAVFTVVGIWAQWQSQVSFAQPNSSSALDYYVFPLLMSSLAPWFTLTGLFAGVGVVFLHAVRWEPRE